MPTRLPADSHVHSEWSWDTGGPSSSAAGRMRLMCERALAIGLPAVVFTEHFDFDSTWRTEPEDLLPHQQSLLDSRGYLAPPPLDIVGYLDSIDRCRHRFPELTILTGVEFGQPHLYADNAAELVDLSAIDRVNGSLHTLKVGEDRYEPNTLYRQWHPDDVVNAYLDEIPRMVSGADEFEVFCHIDYAVRAWPTAAGPFDPRHFEERFRTAMKAIADSERALEINTRRLRPWIPQWWSEEGGRAVTFGSDAHVPEALADNFPEAVAMIEHHGFTPGRRPEDFWTR
ncbi:PHP domain-containing protein [Rhodococcus sp. SGAir0479]|uniref:PHP domain-containing protein n=1 Tax=Rhodococcus sp. SGAir0479 TaxID=2567884 RepID=UPI0010CD52D5|nr:PHP domain-containing protein [Rhodococcus sp. SGAir0479]QCQ90944.1 PHP domain-containing protein [Rhodococcus sp. SGAir0479]